MTPSDLTGLKRCITRNWSAIGTRWDTPVRLRPVTANAVASLAPTGSATMLKITGMSVI